MNSRDMRRFIRVPFASSQKIDAMCRFSESEDKIYRCHVANISEGGIGLMANKKDITVLRKNDILILEKITGNRHLDFLTNLELEVKWVIDSPILETLGFGCSFRDIPESLRLSILRFMNSIDNYPLQA